MNLFFAANAAADPPSALQQQVMRGGLPSESSASSQVQQHMAPRPHFSSVPTYFSNMPLQQRQQPDLPKVEHEPPRRSIAQTPVERPLPRHIAGFHPLPGACPAEGECLHRAFVELYVYKLGKRVATEKKELDRLRGELRRVGRADVKQANVLRTRIEALTERLTHDTFTYETSRTELASNPSVQWFLPPRDGRGGDA